MAIVGPSAGLRSPQQTGSACVCLGQGGGVLGAGSLHPISSGIPFCCSSRLAVAQAPCSEDDPASLVSLPSGSCPAPDGELSVAGRVESVGQCTSWFTSLEPVVCCDVGGLGDISIFVSFTWSFCLCCVCLYNQNLAFLHREFPLK